jgi:hypothetical protein
MPHPKIYKMNRNLRAGNTSKDLCKKYPDFPNRYSENLLAISQGLTTEEFSSIKLLLQTNNIVTCKKLVLQKKVVLIP